MIASVFRPLSLLALAGALSACVSTSPTAPGQASSSTARAEAMGQCAASTVGGAVIGGLLAGAMGEDARQGAVAGAVAGGVHCAYTLWNASQRDKARIAALEHQAAQVGGAQAQRFTADDGSRVDVETRPAGRYSTRAVPSQGQLRCRPVETSLTVNGQTRSYERYSCLTPSGESVIYDA